MQSIVFTTCPVLLLLLPTVDSLCRRHRLHISCPPVSAEVSLSAPADIVPALLRLNETVLSAYSLRRHLCVCVCLSVCLSVTTSVKYKCQPKFHCHHWLTMCQQCSILVQQSHMRSLVAGKHTNINCTFECIPAPNRTCLAGTMPCPLLSLYRIIYVTWYTPVRLR